MQINTKSNTKCQYLHNHGIQSHSLNIQLPQKQKIKDNCVFTNTDHCMNTANISVNMHEKMMRQYCEHDLNKMTPDSIRSKN